jgi:hypothetical protein
MKKITTLLTIAVLFNDKAMAHIVTTAHLRAKQINILYYEGRYLGKFY